ncbi:glycoside hydrolase superfamily [Aspergillus granulosus]|uniref:Glycoside hydrolase superfamily n=1 Tax=Aspergillus granulosus TaxID=176169 RepID=A0ABR4H8B2_9EURO
MLSKSKFNPHSLVLCWLVWLLCFSHAEDRSLSRRQRISLHADWRFSRFEEIPDGVSYDHRPGLPDTAGTKVLKPWILPCANEFINDPNNQYQRPAEDPVANISFVHKTFDDGAWERVHLPHDWAIKGPFYAGDDVPVSGPMGRLPIHGVGWYRRRIAKTRQDEGKSIFLDVEGAMSYAMVWLNGHLVGGWPFGYNSFRLHLTPYLHWGDDNQLAIRIENPTNSSRWYPGAGLYRNVWLTKVDQTHIARDGTFVTSRSVSPKSATVDISISIEHTARTTRRVKVATDVHHIDPSTGQLGAKVGSFPASTVRLAATTKHHVNSTLQIRSPKLWGPWPDQTPHLYRAITRLSSDNRIIDTYETQFGIRSLAFDSDKGLLVNGRLTKIQGVNQHHDLGALGTAFNRRAAERQLQLLQELGCNGIRMAHNPPAPELLDLTDHMGFLVVNEIFDAWNVSKNEADSSLIFADWHEADLRTFIQRDRNHPSVIAWSFGNEVVEQTSEEGALVAQRLHDIVKQEDSTRPAVQSLHAAKPSAPIVQVQDVINLNYQGEGTFDGPAYSYLPPHFHKPPQYPEFHKAHPDKLLWGSETAATLSSRGTYFFPVTGFNAAPLNDTDGGNETSLHVSAYELYTMYGGSSPDKVFMEQDQYPYVAGEFVWAGWDYLGETYLYPAARSTWFGIIDMAGFKKDRFYLYQSRWRPDLRMAHILPHWTWPDRVGEVTPVHVFSAADEAELYLNGKSLGRKQRGPFEYRFRWDQVVYQPGRLRVVTYKNGREWATNSVRTAGPATRLQLTADRLSLAGDGEDLVFITADVLDSAGTLVPSGDALISFSISGPGEIVATDNGDQGDLTAFSSTQRKAFSGKALAIVRAVPGRPGRITVRAHAQGLRDSKITVEVV